MDDLPGATGPPDSSATPWWSGRWWSRPSRLRRAVVVVVTIAVSLGLLGASYAFVVVRRIDRLDLELRASQPGGHTYLIVGVDSRANLTEQQRHAFGSTPLARADIVLLLRIPDAGPPVLVSISRDLLLLGRDGGLHRLALEWLDGPQALVDTLCRSLGIGVDHLVSIELAGFIDLVDAVGGIDITFPNALRDRVVNFSVEAGRRHLDGDAALQYVRSRHLEYATVFGWFPREEPREEQAQAVLRAVSDKAALSRGPLVLHRLLWAASGSIAVDDGTGLRDLRRALGTLQALDTEQTLTLPVFSSDGPIPYAELAPGAAAMLRQIGAGGEKCPEPAFREARL